MRGLAQPSPVTRRPSIAFVSNGARAGAAGERAARIGNALGSRADVTEWFRNGGRVRSAVNLARGLRRARPDVTYLVDLAAAPLAAWLIAGRPGRLIVDTGDAPRDFIRLVSKNRVKRFAASALEHVGYTNAAQIVVRGPFHAVDLNERGFGNTCVIPDGVDLSLFRSQDASELRLKLGLEGAFVVGIQGNFTWYPELGGGLGWEAVNALTHLTDLPIHVLLIGEGPGIVELRALASEAGLADRLHTIGRVSIDALPSYLSVCDVFLLTQTNDPSSWIRTTGKLPGYLAMGRPVLASQVGTASELLPADMLIEYNGEWDLAYPQRLADRIRYWYGDEHRQDKGQALTPLADEFDYDKVSEDAALVALEVAR